MLSTVRPKGVSWFGYNKKKQEKKLKEEIGFWKFKKKLKLQTKITNNIRNNCVQLL